MGKAYCLLSYLVKCQNKKPESCLVALMSNILNRKEKATNLKQVRNRNVDVSYMKSFVSLYVKTLGLDDSNFTKQITQII